MAGKHESAVLLESSKAKTAPPPMFKVLLLNDDYTPMDFVVDVLKRFFGMNLEKATRVMLQVHTEGSGLCGLYPRDIAETKVNQVLEFSQQHLHPLQCVMEKNG